MTHRYSLLDIGVSQEGPEKVSGLKIVEADDYDTVERFLTSDFKLSTATISPVSQFFRE